MPLIKIKVKYGTANKIFNVERTLPNIHEVFVVELNKKYPNEKFEIVYRLKDVEIKVVDTPSLLAAIDDCIKNKQAFLQLEGIMEAAPEPPKEEPKKEEPKPAAAAPAPKKEEPKPAAQPQTPKQQPAAAPAPKKEEPKPAAQPKKEEPKPAAAPAAAAPKPKFCSNCGASLTGGKFCAECGAPTGAEPAKPAAPAAAPESKPQRPSTPPKNVLEEDETKCGKCGKVVEGGIKALGKYWHTNCFVCSVCGEQFGGSRRLMEHEGKPICSGCYEETCVPRCFKCGKPLNGKYLVVDGHEYHPDCFVCTRCGKPFTGSYMLIAGKPVCKKCV